MPLRRLQHIHRFVWLQLFLLAATVAYAQELRYQFKNYTPSDGLPSSETYQVLRDASNYMWFATDHGVTRYNGYEFETFNLPDNSIMGLYEDSKKRVWAYTFSGRLFFYENGKFHPYKWNDKLVEALLPGIIHNIYIDSAEVMHTVSTGPNNITISPQGFLKSEIEFVTTAKFKAIDIGSTDFFVTATAYPEKFQSKRYIDSDEKSLLTIFSKGKARNFVIPHLMQHERCRMKLLSDGRVILYAKNCYIIIKPSNEYEYVPTSYTVDDVEEVDGFIFMATEHGLQVLDNKGRLLETYLQDIHVTSIEKDFEGNVWFSTLTNGVYFLNHFRIKHLAYKGSIVDKRINVVQRLSDSSFLAGVHGNEVIRFKPGLLYSSIKMDLRDVISFYEVNPSFILVGGSVGWYNSELWKMHVEQRQYPATYFLIPNHSNFAAKDSVLYSGLSSSVFEYTFGNFKVPNNFRQIKEVFRTSKIFIEKNGSVLVGNHFGLWRYKNGAIFLYDSTKPLLKSRITDIAYYQNKFLTLSTRGKGLLMLMGDSIYQIKFSDGLVSDNLKRILIKRNNIWLASNNGLSVITVASVQPFQYSIKNFTVQDGLLSNEINSIEEMGEDILIGANHGISFINVEKALSKEKTTLPLVVRSIRINNQIVEKEQLQHLNHRNRNLNISFEGLNYSEPGKTNYRYRIKESGDTAWVYTNNRELQFNPLPYGSYTLEIQAKRSYDLWGVDAAAIKLPIECKRPFWSTTWFWLLISAVVLILLLLGFRNRIQVLKQRQKEREELQSRIGSSEQMALKAQMNPHFIFNSLNSIQQYVIESDVKGANQFISGFSRLIRQTLEFSSKEFISLQEEVSYLTTYLDLEKARMESKFEYTVHVETLQPASQLELPPLLLQPYVENALRHGIKYRKNADGLIQLFFIEYPGILECIIEDNGIGRKRAMELKAINPIEYQSRGMALTAERVLLLNKQREQKIEIIIEDLVNTEGLAAGTRIRVRFPIE